MLARIPAINKYSSLAVVLLMGLAVACMMVILTPSHEQKSASISEAQTVPQIFVKEGVRTQLPAILSLRDEKLYREIFALEKQEKWHKADALIAELTDKKLLGHVLAGRYLHEDYATTPGELKQWLNQYSDHPQATRISALAARKNPKADTIMLVAGKLLKSYGDDNGLAKWKSQSRFAGDWDKALTHWRKQDYGQAAKLFSNLAKQEDLHEWKISASGFWAWRAYTALGNKKEAANYLYIAAGYPRTFYGILARQKLGLGLELQKTPQALSDSEVLEVMAEDAIRRAIALARVGAVDLADSEIRQLFSQSSEEEKYRLLTIANELNLASLQIAMAQRMATDERTLDFARYPIPGWQPYTGFRIEPALIYAMARQESGFRNHAISPAGAMGVMQLMPDTVAKMKKHVSRHGSHSITNASEPAANITLGQSYIEHLLDTPMVENNMFYLLTAYNAGPGRLAKWKKTINYKGDPLLFLESIPYGETRSYVMQVMTNYWIYSDLMGNATRSQQALLKNQWPAYEPPSVPVAVALARTNAG